MESFNPPREQKENFEKEISAMHIEIDEDVSRYGGTQKYVLLESDEGYHFGTTSQTNHTDIEKKIRDSAAQILENRGGGFLKFLNDEIEISEQSSLNLGPLQISKRELLKLLEGKIEGYIIKLPE
jgi:hypothetical protein